MKINASDLAAVKNNCQESSAPRGKHEVTVTDINLPFSRIVCIMVKWSLASIPAFIILALIGMVGFALIGGAAASLFHK